MYYISGMKKRDVNQVLAKNLKAAIERKFDGKVNQSALARLSGVSQKTISNILSAADPTPGETPPSPSLYTLEALAEKLGVAVWELVHPDPEKARREQDFYRKIEEDFVRLPKSEEPKPPFPERRNRDAVDTHTTVRTTLTKSHQKKA